MCLICYQPICASFYYLLVNAVLLVLSMVSDLTPTCICPIHIQCVSKLERCVAHGASHAWQAPCSVACPLHATRCMQLVRLLMRTRRVHTAREQLWAPCFTPSEQGACSSMHPAEVPRKQLDCTRHLPGCKPVAHAPPGSSGTNSSTRALQGALCASASYCPSYC